MGYEMNDIEKAADYLAKAQDLAENVFGSKRLWPHLEALSGLIGLKRPGQSAKGADRDQERTHADGQEKRLGNLLYHRARLRRSGTRDARAKANFDNALKIKADCLCAKLWLRESRRRPLKKGWRDVQTGTKTLETLWEKTGKRSWRLGYFLVEA